MQPANENTPEQEDARCPICGKPSQMAYRPFCSKRCADVDLQRWLSDRYTIPAAEGEADQEGEGEEP